MHSLHVVAGKTWLRDNNHRKGRNILSGFKIKIPLNSLIWVLGLYHFALLRMFALQLKAPSEIKQLHSVCSTVLMINEKKSSSSNAAIGNRNLSQFSRSVCQWWIKEIDLKRLNCDIFWNQHFLKTRELRARIARVLEEKLLAVHN